MHEVGIMDNVLSFNECSMGILGITMFFHFFSRY